MIIACELTSKIPPCMRMRLGNFVGGTQINPRNYRLSIVARYKNERLILLRAYRANSQEKNGTMRLCIDLRPLNSRVAKQKYSFPLIEDCLSHLANKAVFNLLDMKDSFYQIKVHSDDTKYFSFTTLDGQFEYNRLPFGFCPPSFKNVSYKSFNHLLEQINWSQIRINKLIVYIDDILVATDSVDENLEILWQMFIILKKYNYALNYSKCQFLKIKIEYLGYIFM